MFKFSLRTKFLLVMSALLCGAVGIYLILAVTLFNNDKTTYIFESNATLVNTLASETASNLKSVQKTMRLMMTSVKNSGSLDKLFQDEDELVEISVFKAGAYPTSPTVHLYREDFFKPYDVNKSLVLAEKIKRSPNATSLNNKVTVYNASLKDQIPLLGLVMKMTDDDKQTWILSALLRQDRRIKLFSRSETFTTYLTDRNGNILAHPSADILMKRASVSGTPIFNQVIASKFETAVKEVDTKTGPVIYAYSKMPDLNLFVISEIGRSKAFLASQRLIEKSVLFAILILTVSLVVSVLFSKKITASLVKLFEATEEIMKGNYFVKVEISSQDEVGSLASSFNRMAGEISHLMQETADKARMEKELETAQIVQDNFFPIQDLDLEAYSVSAFYKPASECGGDWWGHMLIGQELVLLIGDATGHGVPSALITAAAQSCCSTLEAMKADNPSLKLTPSVILTKLNNSIFRASRGTVKMTFVCVIVDMTQGKLRYANASHEMPLLCRANQQDLSAPRQKKDMVVCGGKSGFILGNESDAQYEESEVALLPGEVLVMYTDGLVECKNSEEQMYGKGRLLRHIFKNATLSAKELKESLITDAITFFGERDRDDDVTLIVLKHKESAASVGLAG